VSTGFNWTLASVVISVVGIIVALGVAITNLRHDSNERAKQHKHDSGEREDERAARRAERAEDQRAASLFRARNVIGGPPARLRLRAELPAGPGRADGGGPTIINASDSIITDVTLIGATTPLDPGNPLSGRIVWYRRRRSGDGNASVVLPHDEVEFPANWLQEIDDDGQYHVQRIHPRLVMYWGMSVAFAWTDSAGKRWIRLGKEDPYLKPEEAGLPSWDPWDWMSKNPPDD